MPYQDMIRKMTKAKEAFPEVTNEEDRDFLTTFAFISMLCFDVYMRKHMIEKMIDQALMGGKTASAQATNKVENGKNLEKSQMDKAKNKAEK